MQEQILDPNIKEEALANCPVVVEEFPGDPVLLPIELDKWTDEIEKQLLLCLINERLERAELDNIILRFRNFTPEAIEAKICEFLKQKSDAQRAFDHSVLRTQKEAVHYMLTSKPKVSAMPRSMLTGGPFHMQAVPRPEAWRSRRVFSAPFQVEIMREMIRAGNEQRFLAARHSSTRPPNRRLFNFRRPRKAGESGEVNRITASELAKLGLMLHCGESQSGMKIG